MSPEIDIAPMRDADADALSDQLSFDVGEWSEFHATYGFYIEGAGKRTAILPPDWEYRLVGVRSEATNNATGLCLDPHDLGHVPWSGVNLGSERRFVDVKSHRAMVSENCLGISR
ncbi:hypothetical protein ACFFGR_15175, partial [Arthrobacter liuii]